MPRSRLPLSRRQLLAGSTAAVTAHLFTPALAHARGTVERRAPAAPGVPEDSAERLDPAPVKQLALRAVDAAKAAGATYADVRLTRTLGGVGYGDIERLGVGVRALVNGGWGFAASPVWRPEEMTTLATQAVAMAKVSASVRPRVVDWRPIPIATGDWTTPIEIDPFTVPLEERQDLIAAWWEYQYWFRAPGGTQCRLMIDLGRQERVVATTEGALFTQTLYETGAGVDCMTGWIPQWRFGTSARGWEHIRDAKLLDQLPILLDEQQRLSSLPVKAIDLGRYDVIVDGWSMSPLVTQTLGRATELSRAMGYEANTSGTSWLGPDPLALLGTMQVGSPLLTLTADRSLRHGLATPATVKWDDEGVEPEVATLIKDGILTDYQTTREQAGWLAPYYEKVGRPVRSHGYAGAESALSLTEQTSPNLVLAPAREPVTVEDLIADTKRGIFIQYTGWADVDFQCKTGTFSGFQQEIVNGKLGAHVDGVCLFSAQELWNKLIALGGPATVEGVESTVSTGAAKFKDLTITR